MPYKDPEKQRAYKREWAKMRRVGENGTPCGTLLSLTFRVKTAQDVLVLLEEQVNAVRNDQQAGTLEKARCILSLILPSSVLRLPPGPQCVRQDPPAPRLLA